LTHDFQTEGHYILSGGETLLTDGYLVNGRHLEVEQNGWSCLGTAYGVKKVEVKVGDVVIVPPGVVHGWADVPDHVDYLSFLERFEGGLGESDHREHETLKGVGVLLRGR
jgi:hypothetical protein